MLLIMIPDQYPVYHNAVEIYNRYFDNLDIMILFSYPSSIVITRDYCIKLLGTYINDDPAEGWTCWAHNQQEENSSDTPRMPLKHYSLISELSLFNDTQSR